MGAVTHFSKDNDNAIKLFSVDGKLDEIHFSDCRGEEWTVIRAEDLRRALVLSAPDFFKQRPLI